MTMMTETLVSGTTPVSDNVNLKQHLNTPSEEGQTLRGSVEKALHNYFAHLEGAVRHGRVQPGALRSRGSHCSNA
jgi:Fis family transcriptional regulator